MSTSSPSAAGSAQHTADPLRLIDVDHIRFYVGNAKQSAYFYAQAFGFEIEQVADLTTGVRDSATYLLTQGNIRFLVTTGLTASHPAQDEVRLYGDGIQDIAFTVDDAHAAYEQALRNGAESAYEPVEISDEHGSVVMAGVKTFGRVVHSFVSRTGDYGLEHIKENPGASFMPGFAKTQGLAINEYNRRNPTGLFYVDHCVGNVGLGEMDVWVKWYEDVLGF